MSMTNYRLLQLASPEQVAYVFHELRMSTFKEVYKSFGIEFNPSQEEIDADIAELVDFLMSEHIPSEED